MDVQADLHLCCSHMAKTGFLMHGSLNFGVRSPADCAPPRRASCKTHSQNQTTFWFCIMATFLRLPCNASNVIKGPFLLMFRLTVIELNNNMTCEWQTATAQSIGLSIICPVRIANDQVHTMQGNTCPTKGYISNIIPRIRRQIHRTVEGHCSLVFHSAVYLHSLGLVSKKQF